MKLQWVSTFLGRLGLAADSTRGWLHLSAAHDALAGFNFLAMAIRLVVAIALVVVDSVFANTPQQIEGACGILCPQVSRQCAADITCATCKGNDCNSPTKPSCCDRLEYGDGDCDHDSDCMGNLLCGSNNCGDFRDSTNWPTEALAGWDTTDDCCYAPSGPSHFVGGMIFGIILVLCIGGSVVSYQKGWFSKIKPGVEKLRALASVRARTGSTPPLSASDTYTRQS